MEANQHLEADYTPSLFSKRFPTRDELLAHYENFAKNGKYEDYLFLQLSIIEIFFRI